MKLADDPFSWESKNGVLVPVLNVIPEVDGGVFAATAELRPQRQGKKFHLGRLALLFGISERDMHIPPNGDADILSELVRFTSPGVWEILTEGEIINMYSQYRVPIANNVLYEYAPNPSRLK